jgi:hypothetical protein
MPAMVCRFGAKCKKADCTFDHPPADRPSPSKSVGSCRFGAKCKKADCTFDHPPAADCPSPSKSVGSCRFGTKCKKADCTFDHPPAADRPSLSPSDDLSEVRGTTHIGSSTYDVQFNQHYCMRMHDY